MRHSREELAELRAAALRSERLVSRKIHRMTKGDAGIDVSGTQYDPRVGKDKIMGMSGDRLKKVIEKQEYFRRASVGYYKGAQGTIVERQAYRNYVNSVRKINTQTRKEQRKYEDVFIKPLGMTAKERRAMNKPAHPVFGSDAYDGMKELKIFKPQQIMGSEGAKMIALRNDDLRRQYQDKRMIQVARENMNKMLDVVGSDEARVRIAGLTDNQFWFLWTHTDFPEELSIKYLAMQLQMQVLDGSAKQSPSMIDAAMERGEQSLGRAMEYVEYAKTLDL